MNVDGEFITHSADQTFDLGYEIGESLKHSSVLLVEGDLGAGKTVFAKGIAAGLDIDPADVNSPTFTIVNHHRGRMNFYHLDLYRLEGNFDELVSLGLDEMIEENDAVILIEWAERLGSFPLTNYLRIQISDQGADNRKITIMRA